MELRTVFSETSKALATAVSASPFKSPAALRRSHDRRICAARPSALARLASAPFFPPRDVFKPAVRYGCFKCCSTNSTRFLKRSRARSASAILPCASKSNVAQLGCNVVRLDCLAEKSGPGWIVFKPSSRDLRDLGEIRGVDLLQTRFIKAYSSLDFLCKIFLYLHARPLSVSVDCARRVARHSRLSACSDRAVWAARGHRHGWRCLSNSCVRSSARTYRAQRRQP